MFPEIAVLVSLIGLLAATYTDLKARIVPNRLNFGLISAGLLIYSVQSVYTLSFLPIAYSLVGLASGFAFGWVLWKLGVFAGGDVKLFAGLGSLNPFTPMLFAGIIGFPAYLQGTLFIFPVLLFVYSLFAFLPYGFGMALYRLSKNAPFRKKLLSDLKQRAIQAVHFSFFSAGAYTVIGAVFFPILVLEVIVLWGFLGKYRKLITVLVVAASALTNIGLFLQSLAVVMAVSVGLYSILKIMFSVRKLLSKQVKVGQLEEGMIPASTFAWKGKKVVEVEPLSLKQIIKYAKKQKIGKLFSGKEIISSRKARGLTMGEIRTVRRLSKAGKMPKELLIKDSMAFVPTILLGYIVCLFLGNFFLFLILRGA